MADIFHILNIRVTPDKVFEGISTPQGLEHWWTKSSEGKCEAGETYTLDFGPQYSWKAVVTKYLPGKEFELEMTKSDSDWDGTRVGFILTPDEKAGYTRVSFYHTGWPASNEHYRISSYCWAMYLRILKQYLEHGENIPYEERLDV